MSVSIHESSPMGNQVSEPTKVPANILLFIAYSMSLTQDTQSAQRLGNQEAAVKIALQQAMTLIDIYKPSKTEGNFPQGGGILSYRAAVISYLTNQFKQLAETIARTPDDKQKKKLEGELRKIGSQINQAQAEYQSDSVFCNATINQMNTVLQKLQTAVKNDDNNLTHMTQRVKVMMSLIDFTRTLIASYKK